MKDILRAFAAFFLFGLVVYLIGSFCSASFDIAQWNVHLRGFLGFGGGIGAIALALAAYNDEI